MQAGCILPSTRCSHISIVDTPTAIPWSPSNVTNRPPYLIHGLHRRSCVRLLARHVRGVVCTETLHNALPHSTAVREALGKHARVQQALSLTEDPHKKILIRVQGTLEP